MSATYDRDRSTRWTSCYTVQSATQPGVKHFATLDHRTGVGRCSCLAGRFNKPCKHVGIARRADRLRWWATLIGDMTAEHRRQFADVLTGRIAGQDATEDDKVAWAVIEQREQEREGRAA